jgi:hypothetical protein
MAIRTLTNRASGTQDIETGNANGIIVLLGSCCRIDISMILLRDPFAG